MTLILILYQLLEALLGLGFTDIFSCHGYDSLVNIPTRKTSSAGTCIDHIYAKLTISIKSGVLCMIVSDHDAIFCRLINQRPLCHLKNFKFRMTGET